VSHILYSDRGGGRDDQTKERFEVVTSVSSRYENPLARHEIEMKPFYSSIVAAHFWTARARRISSDRN